MNALRGAFRTVRERFFFARRTTVKPCIARHMLGPFYLKWYTFLINVILCSVQIRLSAKVFLFFLFLFIYLFIYLFYFILFYFIITLGIQLQYSYTVLTYNKTTKFTYVTALLLTCLLLTYIKIPKTSLQQTKGLLKTINKWKEKKRKEKRRKKEKRRLLCLKRFLAITTWDNIDNNC